MLYFKLILGWVVYILITILQLFFIYSFFIHINLSIWVAIILSCFFTLVPFIANGLTALGGVYLGFGWIVSFFIAFVGLAVSMLVVVLLWGEDNKQSMQ